MPQAPCHFETRTPPNLAHIIYIKWTLCQTQKRPYLLHSIGFVLKESSQRNSQSHHGKSVLPAMTGVIYLVLQFNYV